MKEYTEPVIEITEYSLKDIIAVSDAYYIETSSTTSTSSDSFNSTPETPIDDGPITDLDDF